MSTRATATPARLCLICSNAFRSRAPRPGCRLAPRGRGPPLPPPPLLHLLLIARFFRGKLLVPPVQLGRRTGHCLVEGKELVLAGPHLTLDPVDLDRKSTR